MDSEKLKKIHQHVEGMRMRCTERDQDSYLVRMVRKNRMHEMYPQHYSDDMPQMMVSNTIDNAARDTNASCRTQTATVR